VIYAGPESAFNPSWGSPAGAEAGRPESLARLDAQAEARRQLTVLLADDEEMVRLVLAQALCRAGYNVIAACDGAEAVNLCRGRLDEIDVVVFDLTMPILDGTSLFREIRRVVPRARTLLMSGYSESSTVNDLFEEGLSGFLPKPFSLQQFELEMARVMATGC
jgi:two-component system cell cycle sensor histidine kinase/response regulator CckA